MPAVIILICYSLLMLAGGLWAFMNAPPEANAATALAVPGIIALAALVAAALLARGSARIKRMTHIITVALLIVIMAQLGLRATKAAQSVDAHRAALRQFDAAVMEGRVTDTSPASRRTMLRSLEADDHDKTYLRNTLYTLLGLTLVTAIALLFARPRQRVATSLTAA